MLPAVLLFACIAANAQEAGSVIFATGSVTAEREPPVSLAKGDVVLERDVVATGEASRAQLLMLDGAKIAIRPSSRLRIDEYVFAGDQDADAAVVTTSNDRSVTSLIKGGFRTITGAIGKDDEEAYEVRTPVGVLGIRGTDYSAVFCNADCNWVPGVNPNAPIEDGLYLGVTEGIIFFRNEIADLELRTGEYAFIPLVARVPTPLDAPPPVLIDDNDLRFDPGADAPQPPPRDPDARPDPGDDDGPMGFDSKLGTRRVPETGAAGADADGDGIPDGEGGDTPKQPVIATDPDGTPIDITPGDVPPPAGDRTISYSSGPLGIADSIFSGTLLNEPAQYRLDSAFNLTGFDAPYPSRTGSVNGMFELGTAANVETGFDSMTVMRWGRWSGGTATITLPGMIDASQDLTNQSLHWVSSGASTAPVMPITGVANYTLIGASAPTDDRGNVGVLGDASFVADFTNMIVDSTLTIDINASTWTAQGTGNIGAATGLPAHLFQGTYLNVAVDGIGGGTGVFSGFFSEPGPSSDPTFPGGVGLTYSLQDGLGASSVSGAAVFGNP